MGQSDPSVATAAAQLSVSASTIAREARNANNSERNISLTISFWQCEEEGWEVGAPTSNLPGDQRSYALDLWYVRPGTERAQNSIG